MSKIQRALLSVYDKTGLIPFAETLVAAGVELISTGGTASTLRAKGLPVKDLSEHTGFPEMLDGRVKTLHPKVHGGLLYRRDDPAHEAAVRQHGIEPIDLVVVNLYPFEQTVAKPNVTLSEAIENIDIGGPSMLRSAAKNHQSVTVVVDPADYAAVSAQIRATGNTTLELRRQLAARVFARTAAYDAAIAGYLQTVFGTAPGQPSGALPATLCLSAPQAQPLRYGENPHQRAALYGQFSEYFQQLHGKELSYNNILDLTAAANLIAEFAGDTPTLAILKHTNPSGVLQVETLREPWTKPATDQQAPLAALSWSINRSICLAREPFRNLQRSDRGAGVQAGAWPCCKEKESASAQVLKISVAAPVDLRSVGPNRFCCRTRSQDHERGRFESSHATKADRRGNAGALVRLARGQARQIQRDCLCRPGSNARHWCRPNEPRGREPPCSWEGGRGGFVAPGKRRLQRRLFFLSRTASSPRPRQERQQPFNRAARCATRK